MKSPQSRRIYVEKIGDNAAEPDMSKKEIIQTHLLDQTVLASLQTSIIVRFNVRQKISFAALSGTGVPVSLASDNTVWYFVM